jgi:hypothetical protein
MLEAARARNMLAHLPKEFVRADASQYQDEDIDIILQTHPCGGDRSSSRPVRQTTFLCIVLMISIVVTNRPATPRCHAGRAQCAFWPALGSAPLWACG